MNFFSNVYCIDLHLVHKYINNNYLLARAFIAVVAVFALARSTGAAGLGTADAADVLAVANPEIFGKNNSENCPLAKNSVLLHFLLSYSFIIPLLLHTTIVKCLVTRKYRNTGQQAAEVQVNSSLHTTGFWLLDWP